MSILNYLPNFKVVEVNRLAGLTAGHMLSQFPADDSITLKQVGTSYFLENGLIVGLNNDLTVGNFDPAEHAQPFLVFNEELNTFVDGLKYFAEPVVNGEVYPRAIGLYIGDAFTTDNYDANNIELASAKFATIGANGVLKFVATATDAYFAVEASTLPTGEAAARVTYMGVKNTIQEAVASANAAALSATAAEEALEDIEGAIDTALEESGSIKTAIDTAVEAHAILTTGVHGLE